MFKKKVKKFKPVTAAPIKELPYDPKIDAYVKLSTMSYSKIEAMIDNDMIPAYESFLLVKGLKELSGGNFDYVESLKPKGEEAFNMGFISWGDLSYLSYSGLNIGKYGVDNTNTNSEPNWPETSDSGKKVEL